MPIYYPMNILTVNAGARRKLLCKPVSAVKRDSIKSMGSTFMINHEGIEIPSGGYSIETKEQGHFHFYSRDEDGEYSLYGKRETVMGTYRDIWPLVKQGLKDKVPSLPKETAIAIELIWPNHQDSKVPTAIKDCPHKLEVRALAVAIYRGVLIMGTDMPYLKGRKILYSLFSNSQIVKYYDTIYLQSKEGIAVHFTKLLEYALSEKIEGYVLKGLHYNQWYKLKGVKECDAFVIGFKISNSDNYEGQVTSLELGMWDGSKVCPVGRASGLSDEIKIELTDKYNKYQCTSMNPWMYSVCRVKYQEIGTRGGIKHGFFDGWRDDKDQFDCPLSQIL